MKAVVLKNNGGIENLIYTEMPLPAIGVDEVLIQVKAIGINPVDAFVRQHSQALANFVGTKEGEDVILGWDASGTVVEAGPGVTDFKKGDDVFGLVKFPGHGKAYAEYVAAPASHLARKPLLISHAEAGAATLAALTAWQALVTYAKIKSGEKVVIHAAAGGVGHYAVQIAKHFGAYVIAVGSAPNKDFILGLGADEFIDHHTEKFEDKAKNADVVIDSIFGDHVLRSLDVVKKGGRVISLLTFIEGAIAQKAKDKDVFAHRVSVVSNGADMKRLAELLEHGAVRSHLYGVYSFADLAKAHQQIETRKTRGKIVVDMEK